MIKGSDAVRRERIDIEERIAAERDAGKKAVVEGPLQYVDILGLPFQQKHPLVPEHAGDGGTGLGVGGFVGQGIVGAELLAPVFRPDTPGQVHLLPHHIFPDPVQGGDIVPVARQGGHVGRAGVEVSCPHRVPHRLILFHQRLVILAVVAEEFPVGTVAALFHEEARHVQVLLVARCPVQFHQAQLDFRVTGCRILPAGTEHLADQIGILDGHIKERALSSGLEMSHRSLVHVAYIVQFVGELDVLPTFLADGGVSPVRIQGSCCIEVPVILLGRREQADQMVQVLVQLGIRMQHEAIGRPFHDLEHVRIIKEDALMFAFHEAARLGKIADPARLFRLLEIRRQGHRQVGVQPRFPEPVGEPHLVEFHRPDGIVPGFRRCPDDPAQEGHGYCYCQDRG